MTEGKSSCAYNNYCNRVPHKTSSDGHCIFHAKAEDKTVGDFHQALEKYLSKLRVAKDAVYDFVGFIFPDDIDFKKNFGLNVFEGAMFKHATFEQDAWFQHAIFKGITQFDHATFKGDTSFQHATFEQDALFEHATFEQDAWFRHATFKEMAYFQNATFNGEAWFLYATFEETTVFVNATFKGDTSFLDTIFEGDTFFDRAKFRESASISPKIVKVGISFINATIENIVISPLHLKEEAQIDFGEARLRNTNVKREDVKNHIKQEESEDYREARYVYMLLKNNFHTIGRYDDESWAFRKEKEMERKGFWHFRKEHTERELGKEWSNKGIKDCFYPALFYFEYTAKYLQDHWLPTSGKKINKLFSYMANFPKHPIGTIKGELKNFASFVADGKKEEIGNMSYKELFRALWFYIKYPIKYSWSTFLKYLYGWGEQPWLIFLWCGITIFIFSVLYLGGDVIAKDGTLVKSYLDKLYFSGVTFTTLGYGDFSPIGGTRLLAFIESFLGVFFIALFVFSFARGTAGR